MAKKRALSLALFVTSVIIICGVVGSIPSTELSNASAVFGWIPTVNFDTNQYLMWRDSAYSSLLPSFIPVPPLARPTVMSALIFFLGTALVARVLLLSGGANPVWGWGLALLPTLATLSITGGDTVVLGALAWIPLLALCLSATFLVSKAGLLRKALPLVLITALVSTVCARSANHFAALAAITAVFVARRLHGETTFSLRDSRALGGLAVAFAPAIIVLASIPAAPFPDYPPLAHVVPDDGLAGIVRPLIGVDYPIQVIDRGVVRASYGSVSLALTMLSLSAVALGSGGLAPVAFALSLLAACDTLLPESIAQIAPIAALSRLIPWGTTVAYTPYVVAAAMWLTALVVVTSLRWIISIPLLGALIVTALGISPVSRTMSPEKTLSAALGEISPSTAVVQHLAKALSATSIADLKRPLLDGYIPTFESLATFNASISSPLGDNATFLKMVSDGDPRTRWSAGRSGQRGDESIEITFSKPTPVSGIELDTGTFTADFPRGLTVLGLNSAGELTRCRAEFPSWQGSIARTARGFPYFTGQHEVRVIFSESCLLTKITIKQTGVAPFDWSIAEIKIAP